MTAQVVSFRFPYVPISLKIQETAIADFEAMVDTGFDGHVIVPTGFLASGHPADGRIRWQLGDGSAVLARFYLGTVSIGTLAPVLAIVTEMGDEPRLGRGVTDSFGVTLDHGRRIHTLSINRLVCRSDRRD